MKHRVHQLITFEIEFTENPPPWPSGNGLPEGASIIEDAIARSAWAGAITEEEADAIVEEAARGMLAVYALGSALKRNVEHERLGTVAVRFVECKAEPLSQLMEDRRLLRELMDNLQVKSAVLEAFIRTNHSEILEPMARHPELPGMADGTEILMRSTGLRPKREENQE